MREIETSADLTSEPARGKRWMRALAFGAIAGMVVGVLNLAAIANQWELKNAFKAPDGPMFRLLDAVRGWLEFTGWTAVFDYAWALVMIGYWSLIGLFLASLFCLVRAAIIYGVARDKTCRRALFFAGCGGILVGGGLRLLTWIGNWYELEGYFEDVNWPASILKHVAVNWLGIVPRYPSAHVWLAAQVCYWAIVGWFLGSCICLVWAVRKRKGAVEASVLRECS